MILLDYVVSAFNYVKNSSVVKFVTDNKFVHYITCDEFKVKCANIIGSILPKPKIRIITVDGNIGSGKSTMIKKLMLKHENTYLVPEPVEKWQNIDGTGKKEDNDILAAFYGDMKMYSYKFQNFAYITRMKELRNAERQINCFKWKPFKNLWYRLIRKPIIIITERSILTDKYVFAQMLYDDKLMGVLDKKLYDEWFNYFDDYPIKHAIYIKSTPDISLKRIETRGRISEKTININYLTTLLKYHDMWLNDKKNKLDVLTLNTNDEFESNTPESILRCQKHISDITKFIDNIN
jgi:deoxyadenosine/deoxycytidine kinase